jgi:Flp pilus assembly protein TadG
MTGAQRFRNVHVAATGRSTGRWRDPCTSLRVRRSFVRSDAGQSLVELAVSLPLLLFTLVGGADLARVFTVDLGVAGAARAAASTVANEVSPTTARADALVRQDIGGMPGVDATQLNVTLTQHNGDGTTVCSGPASVGTPCFDTVRVTYTFRPIIAWPGVPSAIAIDRSRTFRRYR